MIRKTYSILYKHISLIMCLGMVAFSILSLVSLITIISANKSLESLSKSIETEMRRSEEVTAGIIDLNQEQNEILEKIDHYTALMEPITVLPITPTNIKESSQIGRGQTTNIKRYPVKFEVSMYTNKGGAPPYKGLMKSGNYTYPGVIAAPDCIPLGSKVVFTDVPEEWSELEKVYTVEDRGGHIKKIEKNGETVYRLDVWTDNDKYANKWGRRTLHGWVYTTSDL